MLSDGSLVEANTVAPDNVHVGVQYLDSMDNPAIKAGAEGGIPFEELIAASMGCPRRGPHLSAIQRRLRKQRRSAPVNGGVGRL